jgi:hypothetical protein
VEVQEFRIATCASRRGQGLMFYQCHIVQLLPYNHGVGCSFLEVASLTLQEFLAFPDPDNCDCSHSG